MYYLTNNNNDRLGQVWIVKIFPRVGCHILVLRWRKPPEILLKHENLIRQPQANVPSPLRHKTFMSTVIPNCL